MNTKSFRKYIILIAASILLISCNETDAPEIVEKDHTVIVYMMANNSLDYYADDNINKMESTWSNQYNGNCVVLKDIRSNRGKLELIEIHNDNKINQVTSPTVKTYTDMAPLNPADMKELLLDIATLYPSKRYSLILWSHATGWLPPYIALRLSTRANESVAVRAFGESGKNQMNLLELAAGIPDNLFENIIFDACFMGGIEVAYELRNKTEYLIASPAEVLAEGFPYHSTIPLLMERQNPAIAVADSFVKYYAEKEDIEAQSATIGAIQTNQLAQLAAQTQILLSETGSLNPILNNKTKIQIFDRYSNHIFYDFRNTLEQLQEEADNSQLQAIFSQLENTVLYKGNTDWFLKDPRNSNFGFEIKTNSGLSCFIPNKNHDSKIIVEYKRLSWYKDSGFDRFFEGID